MQKESSKNGEVHYYSKLNVDKSEKRQTRKEI